jgi:hypothetical protein
MVSVYEFLHAITGAFQRSLSNEHAIFNTGQNAAKATKQVKIFTKREVQQYPQR